MAGLNIPIRVLDEVTPGLTVASDSLKKFADGAIANQTRVVAAYRQMSAEAGAAAKTAVAGSDQQTAALKAQEYWARKAGIATGESGLAGASRVAGREAEAARGKISALATGTKSLVFSLGGLAAGFGAYDLFKTGIDNAEALQKAQDSLKVSIDRLGGSYKQVRPEIAAWAHDQEKFGVSVITAEQGFAHLIPMVGGAKRALEAYHLALILSKGAGIDLTAAERAVAKALDGKTTSLQRYGIVLQKNATAEQVATTISSRYGGQAKANTTAADKLKASVSNVETELGTMMLPTVQKLIGGLADWLDKSRNQQRVLGDVKTAFHDLGTAIHGVTGLVQGIDKATGGFSNTLKLLLGLAVAAKLNAWTGGFKSFIGSEAAGTGVAGASAKSGKLLGNMQSLARMGGITIGLTMLLKANGDKGAKGLLESLFGAGLVGFAVGGPEGALAAASIDLFVHMIASSGKTPFYGAGPGSSKFQLGGKTYTWGTQAADNALRAAGYAGPLKVGAEQAWLAQHPGVTSKAGYKTAKGNSGLSAAGGSVTHAAKALGVGSGMVYGELLGNAGLPPAPGRAQILDCSSYVYEVFTRAGFKNFPDVSESQWSQNHGPNWTSEYVNSSDARPGDVVFYNVPGGEGSYPNHVGIVVSGHGNSAKVMQYTRTGQGAHVYDILQAYPIQGVKRYFLVKKGSHGGHGAASGGGGGAGFGRQQSIGGATTVTKGMTPSQKATARINRILGEGAHVSNKAITAKAAHHYRAYLADERKLLSIERHEAAELRAKIKHSTGQAKQKYEAALKRVQKNIAETQAAIIRAGQELAKATSQGKLNKFLNLLSKIEASVDARYEARIKKLQAADQKINDQQAITDAKTSLRQALALGDPEAVKQAQRELQQARRTSKIDKLQREEDKFNTAIEKLAAEAQNGKLNLKEFNKFLKRFGHQFKNVLDPDTDKSFTSELKKAAKAVEKFAKSVGGHGKHGKHGGGGGHGHGKGHSHQGHGQRGGKGHGGKHGGHTVHHGHHGPSKGHRKPPGHHRKPPVHHRKPPHHPHHGHHAHPHARHKRTPAAAVPAGVHGGGGIVIHMTVNGVASSNKREFAQAVTPEIRRELLRIQGRNANTLGIK